MYVAAELCCAINDRLIVCYTYHNVKITNSGEKQKMLVIIESTLTQ